MMFDVLNIIKRKLMKLRLQPVRVFCLHHVCAQFDASSMNEGDWMSTTMFKAKIKNMQKMGYQFISLQEAYQHIKKDFIRCRKYAVLTFDDGYASLKEILPWLEEQKIPVTLFINGKYLDGKSYRKNPKERYLTKEELWALTSPFIEIGSHGWVHTDVTQMTIEEFKNYFDINVKLLQLHTRFIPFHAYTWGRFTAYTNQYIQTNGFIPVFIDDMKNYNESKVIHRELLWHSHRS